MDQHPSLTKKVIDFFNPPPELVPVNGLQGLRWLRFDAPAGVALSVVAMVFALNISALSHAPLMAGIMSAIVGTWIACLRGGSYLGVCGAAAALSYFISKLVDGLGHGDPVVGFMLTIPIVFIIGVVLYLAGRLGLARYASIASHGISESMMSWIGFSLVLLQVAIFYGIKFTEKHSWDPLGLGIEKLMITAPSWGILVEASHRMAEANGKVLFIGISTLVLLLSMLWAGKTRPEKPESERTQLDKLLKQISDFLRRVYGIAPAQAIAIGYGLFLSYVLKLDPQFCVQLPEHPFDQIFEIPHFGALFDALHKQDNFDLILNYGLSLLWVDALEATLTVRGIDAKDPYKRSSDLNQTLMTIGTANMVGACFHSLTHIWGGLKSTLFTFLRGKTLWGPAISGALVLVYVGVPATREVVNHLPLSGLAAVIAVTAGALCWPSVWKKFHKMGKQEFMVFTTGFAVSGIHGEIIEGVLAAFLLEFAFRVYGACIAYRRHKDPHPGVFKVAVNLFRSPVTSHEEVDGVLHVYLGRPLVGFNMHHLHKAVEGAKQIVVHRGGAIYVDSAANSELDALNARLNGAVCTQSLEDLLPLSDHHHATRILCRRNEQQEEHPRRRRDDPMMSQMSQS